ncbi:hypothetical protein [Ideonella sp. B508-1]|uniref:hypothetical protein n=1 Tax=Ideonella sp. B508-1 TaxID=137716 RepID=UPI0004768138|nr:hypothetical protein [Ideonella sp. B508-1]
MDILGLRIKTVAAALRDEALSREYGAQNGRVAGAQGLRQRMTPGMWVLRDMCKGIPSCLPLVDEERARFCEHVLSYLPNLMHLDASTDASFGASPALKLALLGKRARYPKGNLTDAHFEAAERGDIEAALYIVAVIFSEAT